MRSSITLPLIVVALLVLCRSVLASGDVIITEVNSTEDAYATYVELRNVGDENVDITNWTYQEYINGGGNKIETTFGTNIGVLSPGEYALILRDKQRDGTDNDFVGVYPDVNLVDTPDNNNVGIEYFDVDWNDNIMVLNGSRSIVLRDGMGGTVMDRFDDGIGSWVDGHAFERVNYPNDGTSLDNHWIDLGVNQTGTPAAANDNPLPITLSSFTATLAGDHVLVRWVTQSESDHLGFHVLRATERQGPYTRITDAIIPGAPGGSSEDRRTYAFADPDVVPGRTYFYRLEEVSLQGERTTHGPVSVTIALRPQTLPLRDAAPAQYALLQNTPNPFNPSTAIWYALPRPEPVEIAIYTLHGQRVRTWVDHETGAGWHRIEWDGRDETGRNVSSGVYVVQLRTPRWVEAKKIVKLQ